MSSEVRDLRPLFDPRSIAVVGASADASKWGGDIAARLVRNEHTRPFYFVNRNGGRICGRPAYRSLSELPETPEMVMLSVPESAFEQTLDEALALGVRSIVAIFAGLGETGAEGLRREAAAARRIRDAGALMIGPNCMGVADTTAGFQGVAYLDIPAGHIGLVSQSGAMGEDLTMRARAAGVGFSRYVSLGNQADVTIAEVLRSYLTHEATRVVAVYAEDLKGGRDLARAAADLVAAGKPCVLLAPGRSAAGAKAAMSHTGALAPDGATLEALSAATGITLVDDPGQLFETVVGCLHVACLRRRTAGRDSRPGSTGTTDGAVRLPRGRRIAIVTEGGGHGGVAADVAAAAGLVVPPLDEATLAAVRRAHPPSTGVNPVDFAIGTTDPDAYARVLPAICRSAEVDAVLAVGQLGYWGARFPGFEEHVATEVDCARRMAREAREAGKPLVVATVYPEAPPATALREEGVPVYREIAVAVGVMARLADAALCEPTGVPPLPVPAAPIGRDGQRGAFGTASSKGEGGVPLDYGAARALIADAGIDIVPARVVGGTHSDGVTAPSGSFGADLAGQAVAAAEELGYPVVVKALGLLHKSDVGGVVLSLTGPAAVAAAADGLVGRLRVSALSVERMAPLGDGIELIIGCRQDRRFGPLLLVGMGGLYAELLRDVKASLAPVTEAHAETLLRSLRGAPLLSGARGRQPLDVAAAARAAATLSRFAAAHPEIAEIEVNPLLLLPDGALGLDARVIIAGGAGGDAGESAGDAAGSAGRATGSADGGDRPPPASTAGGGRGGRR